MYDVDFVQFLSEWLKYAADNVKASPSFYLNKTGDSVYK